MKYYEETEKDRRSRGEFNLSTSELLSHIHTIFKIVMYNRNSFRSASKPVSGMRNVLSINKRVVDQMHHLIAASLCFPRVMLHFDKLIHTVFIWH